MGCARSVLFFFILSAVSHAMHCRDHVAIIADPWSTAAELVRAAEARGIEVHGLFSMARPPAWGMKSKYLAPDRRHFYYDGKDYRGLRDRISAFGPDEILYGADGPGLRLVDRLTEDLGLRGNGTQFSLARTTKDLLQARLGDPALKDEALPSLKSELVTDLDSAKRFVESVGGYPVFMKPNDDGGGTNAFPIESVEVLEDKITLILGHDNSTTGQKYSGALLQEFADGVEYAVQGTARDGHIKFSSILKYEHAPVEGGGKTYLAHWLIEPGSRAAGEVTAFIRQANKLVRFRNGAFHWEVKLTLKNGVVAIELNPRIIGGGMVTGLKDAIGYSDVDLVIEAYFFPEEFFARPDVYRIRQHAFFHELLSPRPGMIFNEKALREVERLPGFKRARRHFEGILPHSLNLDSISATLDFSHVSKSVLEDSFERVRELHDAGAFFVTAP